MVMKRLRPAIVSLPADITYSGRAQEGELEKSATREQMELNRRREQHVQAKLREMGVCVMGYPLDRTKRRVPLCWRQPLHLT
jgi:hypothetical protein